MGRDHMGWQVVCSAQADSADLIFAKANEIYVADTGASQKLMAGAAKMQVRMFDPAGKEIVSMKGWPSGDDKPFYYLLLSTKPHELFEIDQKIFASAPKT